VTVLVAILLAPFAILTAVFAIEIFVGLRPARSATCAPGTHTAVIVIPAHDEAEVIGTTLQTLRAALGEGMRVLVVADNCDDETAELARAQGVEVVERVDGKNRGKGFALAYAAEHLETAPPDVLVVLDADCSIDASSLRNLIDAVAYSGRPCQAINLLRPDRHSTPLVQLSTFGFMLKNLVRQRGLQRLAARVHLTGTGMAMPFVMLHAARQVRSSIVEDLALGLELAEAGHRPALVSDAVVWSSGASQDGTIVQRRRWEGGFIATSFRHGPKALLQGIARGDLRGSLAGLDLLIPPLALFAFLNVVILASAGALTFLLDASWWPVVMHVGVLLLAAIAVFIAWLQEGRHFISLGVLARIPLYVLWKLPLYIGLARRGAPTDWLRAGR
jgi:cellulose synthase/poly-beta-1,6-N-acetylglucosamine synthase-like glycosyltransferase